jgi:YD repeat-containing protein
MPLENRLWYAYAGQANNFFGGTFSQPTAIGRVLDDGTSQVRQFSYDTAGFFKMTRMVDPLGRTTNYVYSNQIDLAAISQVTAGGFQTTIAQYTYNYQHRPLTYTDAAGQTTDFAYNAAGQITSITNPLAQTTSYAYDANHNLSTITNANSQTAATYNTLNQLTNLSGQALTFDANGNLTAEMRLSLIAQVAI